MDRYARSWMFFSQTIVCTSERTPCAPSLMLQVAGRGYAELLRTLIRRSSSQNSPSTRFGELRSSVALYPSFDGFEKGLRLLHVREVAALLEDHQLRVGDALVHDLRLRGWADEVVFAHDDECGRGDLAQPRGEVPPLQDGIASLGRVCAGYRIAHHVLGEVLVVVVEVQRLYHLPQAPHIGIVLRRSVESLELLLGRALAPDVGLYLIPVLEVRCGAEQDQVAEVLGVSQCVLQGDTSSEGVAEDGDLLEAQVIAQGVGIGAQPLEGDRLRRRSARATVAPMVVAEQMHHVAQRVEPGVKASVISS